MSEIVLTTYDWVPEMPRGLVRDLRVRWALEEAGLSYRVESTPFRDRGPEHFAAQPFGQVPWLTDGDLTIFESGAILLHLGEKSPVLMPTDPRGRAEVLEWVIAALNSVDLPSQPWTLFRFMGFPGEAPEAKFIDDFLKARLERMEAVLAGREWLAAGRFTVADLLMADVLRQVHRFDGFEDYPACRAYVLRATARPAFVKAYDDQVAHFSAADAAALPPTA
jgi:glutathione S-transferase